MTDLHQRYYCEPLVAFVRGRLRDPSITTAAAALERAHEAELRVHRFKRSGLLPRVRQVLGTLRGLRPRTLLDVGSGRGACLWPLLDAFPTLEVTAIDRDHRRALDLQTVQSGGLARLRGVEMDVTAMAFEDAAFDVVCLLEVLEHLEHPGQAAAGALRVSSGWVVASVPSKPDDNPGHIQLFSPTDLEELFTSAGASRVQVSHVLNHRLVVARRGAP